VGVPPIWVTLNCRSDNGTWERARLGELDAMGELVEQPEQRFDRLFRLRLGRRTGIGRGERVFEQFALLRPAAGEVEPRLATGGVDAGDRGCTAVVGIRQVALDKSGLTLPPPVG
jgi:hypothetical protein